MSNSTSQQRNSPWVLLRQQIARTFSMSELMTICFDLGIDFEELGQGNKTNKVIELISLMQRRGCLGNLLSTINDARPYSEWPSLEILSADEVEVTLDLGQTLNQIYKQDQEQAKTKPTNKPQLADELWSAFEFEKAAAGYKQHLSDHYGFLHILGHNRPVPLEGVFTDVYLYDRPLAHRRLDLKALEEQFRQRQVEQYGVKRVDGLALVKTQSRLFVLGQPGAGKTTFLKHVALQAAKGDLPGIPAFISLKALADSQKPLPDFMAQEMQICGFPEPASFLHLMLQSGQMLILLDGLDEVTQAQETALNLIQGIENLIRQYSANHFLITCRTAVTDYQFPGFTTVEMSNFSREQVDTFIRKWFQHEPSLGNNCLQELNLPEHKGLRDLASTPLLLNLLCLTYEEVGRFPQRRVELYEEALSALLVKWDSSRRIRRDETYRQLSLRRKRQMLAQIATLTFEKGQYFIPKAEMVSHILDYLKIVPEIGELHDDDGEAVLKAIEAQHGIIVERARGVYGFAHLTFQEYFTARYAADVGEESWFNFLNYGDLSEWHEVLLLTTSLLSNADEFFLYFIAYLDELVCDDPLLLSLLTWATNKANQTGQSASSLFSRQYFNIFFALDLILELDSDLDFTLTGGLSYDINPLTQGLRLTRTLKSDIQDEIESDHTSDRDIPDTDISDIDLEIARIRADALSLDSQPDLALDCALVYGLKYGRIGVSEPFIQSAIKLSQVLNLPSLYVSLAGLTVPTLNASKIEHEQFVEALWEIAQQERQLQAFSLNLEQFIILANYLEGSMLLAQCLELATVTDRKGIMSHLLNPSPV